MGFWMFMLIMNLLIPATLLGFGLLFIKRPPGDINAVFGYRTSRSMKNRETWLFAHRVCGRIWLWLGAALLPASVLCMLPLLGRDEDTVGKWGAIIMGVQLAALLVPIIPTEIALGRAFDKDGKPRT